MTTLSTFPAPGGPRDKVGEEIRVLLVRKGRTQTDLAAELGISQSQLSKRLRGAIAFDLDELWAVAAYFNVTIGELFGEVTIGRGPGGPGGGVSAGGGATPEYASGTRDERPHLVGLLVPTPAADGLRAA